MLDLLVGVEGEPVAGRAGRSRSGRMVNSSPRRALFSRPWYIRCSQEVQLGLAHDPLQPQQQTVVVVGRVVEAVVVGQQGVEDRTPLQEMVPVRVGPGQSADLEAKDDADVIEVDLGQEPLEAQCGPRRWCRIWLGRR